MIEQYGLSSVKHNLTEFERHVENIRVKGYTLLKNVLQEDIVSEIRESLDKNYSIQESDLGYEQMKKINELDMLRCPFAYDEIFLSIITNKRVLEIVKAIVGNELLLHLQNGILNRPNQKHHQSSWHRDLPYQEYVISKPLGISAFYCIDEFTEETGGTLLLPYSHKEEKMPSEEFLLENQKQIIADPGDVILFDCMVFHRSGYNSSKKIRRGINNVYVAPLLKQQINFPKVLNGKYADDEELNSLLGYKYDVAESVVDFRKRRLNRLKKD